MTTDMNYLRIERKNKDKFFLFLNDDFISFPNLLSFSNYLHPYDLFFIEVFFENNLIIDGFFVYDNPTQFEKNIHYFSTGKILT